jgi:hypothetical protein
METSSDFNSHEKLLQIDQIILILHLQAQPLQSGLDTVT